MNYAIGDVQGCFSTLVKLLEHIPFDADRDILWFTGDLVNRGPQSLETLRFIKNLGGHHHVVLGNHDLHLLALAHKAHAGWPDDTLRDVLQAPDCEELMAWLSWRPLLYHDDATGFTLVHAGLAPAWDLSTALRLAREIEAVLRGPQAAEFLKNMYGNTPDQWDERLSGMKRWRCITNYLTRMRWCYPNGRLILNDNAADTENNSIPWFKVTPRANAELKIIFGHWAALGGGTHVPRTYALDTGCVWGRQLTAMRLEDEKKWSVPAERLT
jgi:bis(5'-nucleosyl)-tetraphosphatase (symmetrical)